ncbi:DUF6541 family protein, partial [Saccharomonospora iraqiensis]|uniref:DUF6541 family protein n=1 Tax=Saccharomonospora iraqiensis TaxID=52698 RepID=UPI000595503B
AVLTGHARHAARALGLLSGLGGVALALDTWQRGLGAWSTPPQEHDPITHSVISAYIHHSGNAAPWQTWPLDVVSAEPVVYYPSGLPRLAALVTPAVGDPMTGLNVVTVVLLAVAWPVSVAALAAATVRLAGLGT